MEDEFNNTTHGPSEEVNEINKEKLRFLQSTMLDRLALMIEQPLGMLTFFAKTIFYGLTSAGCTIGLSALVESRRLRKETLANYQDSVAHWTPDPVGATSQQPSSGGAGSHLKLRGMNGSKSSYGTPLGNKKAA